MVEVTLAGEVTPMIASVVNARALADACADMLAHLLGAPWCAPERDALAEACKHAWNASALADACLDHECAECADLWDECEA
jgi:hypothetical protein